MAATAASRSATRSTRNSAAPNGGDGGRAASICAVADPNLNTLVDFRFSRRHEAKRGEHGMGSDMFGAAGDDIMLNMPVGTIITDAETGEVVADLLEPGQRCIASPRAATAASATCASRASINRAPRQKTPGWPGEKQNLKLELKVLADVGLLGMPNAGKSTLITAISNARPKIADYPFTTLHPNLGVVRVGPEQSFVVADLPGPDRRRLRRRRPGAPVPAAPAAHALLLHVVDLAPFDERRPGRASQGHRRGAARSTTTALYEKPRWLVLNKLDMVPVEERKPRGQGFRQALRLKGPVFEISALTREGCEALVKAVYQHVKAQQVARAAAPRWKSTRAFAERRSALQIMTRLLRDRPDA